MEASQESAYQTRNRLTDNGYQFCSVINSNKRPVYEHWEQGESPDAIPLPGALNTGILARGLRAIDIDVEEPGLVSELKGLAERYLGQDCLLRTRRNSPRCLLLYRSSEAVPPKKVLFDREKGSIEVLGDGQQFVAYGMHPSGAPYEWPMGAPDECLRSSVPAVSEAQLGQFLAGAAAVLGPPLMSRPVPGQATGPVWDQGLQVGELQDVEGALKEIPNPDCPWEFWNVLGMAVFAATAGAQEGLGLFQAWSALSGKHHAHACLERWKHWEKSSPPEHVGARWLFKQANHHNAEWKKPSELAGLEQIRPFIERIRREYAEHKETVYSLDHCSEVTVNLVASDFVQGLLQDGTLVVVYGPSNSGKTFWATDLGMHVAAGKAWAGHPVQAGCVIYCALEGNVGINHRVFAWMAEHHASQDMPFYILRDALDLTGDTSRLKRTILSTGLRCGQPVRLIIVDTLSRALSGGDENDGKVMGSLVKALDALRSETKVCILLVHHTGKDSARGARGHSILRAAVDTEIEVEAVPGEDARITARFAHVRKQRELQGGDKLEFRLEQIRLGKNDRGAEITTCMVHHVPDMHTMHTSLACKPRMTDPQKWIMRTLFNTIAGELNEGKRQGKYPAMTFKVLVAQLIDENFFREDQLDVDIPGQITKLAYKAFHLELTRLKMLNVLNFNRQLIWPF